jgi:hypothetical protein
MIRFDLSPDLALPNQYVSIILALLNVPSKVEAIATLRDHGWDVFHMSERSWLIDTPCGMRFCYVTRKRWYQQRRFENQRLSYENQRGAIR